MIRPRLWRALPWWVASVVFSAAPLTAQQVQIATPFHSINESFYENFGVGMGGINRMGPNGGWFFGGLPGGSAPPPFGGHDPAADARMGMRLGPLNLGLTAGQGSSRTMVMESPSIVIPSGGSGHLFHGTQRPFVMGVVPVVGLPMRMPAPLPLASATSPLTERLQRLEQGESGSHPPRAQGGHAEDARGAVVPARDDAPLVIHAGRVAESQPAAASPPLPSTATHGDLSLQEIRRQQAAEQESREHEILVLIEKARGKEAEGRPGLAKIYYQQAASRAEGYLKQQLLAKIDSL